MFERRVNLSMNLKNYFWYFSKALSPRLCDQIYKYATGRQTDKAVIGIMNTDRDLTSNPLTSVERKSMKKKRDSNIAWLDEEWINREINPYINIANKNAGWNFQWDYSEPCQFTEYRKGQYYDWHCDSWKDAYRGSNMKIVGKIRKLSMTVSLSNSTDYTGGELEFNYRDLEPGKDKAVTCPALRERGSIIIFPSFVWHRVTPVKSGARHSLVSWHLGHPFL